jgi:hypothetical protein
MPHTSRPKKPTTQKRTTVTDPSGWTHVTNGGNVRRVIRRQNIQEPTLVPAEAPGRLTLSDLQTQFQTHRERWEGSKSWSKVTDVLDQRLKERGNAPVDAVVCIGLGSPSGFLRDGWVDRRAVSLYQLAALASIKDQVECSFPHLILICERVFGLISDLSFYYASLCLHFHFTFIVKPPYPIPYPYLHLHNTNTPTSPHTHPPKSLRPRPSLQHPRRIPPPRIKYKYSPRPRSLLPYNTAHTTLLPRRRKTTSRTPTAVEAVAVVRWAA